MWCSIRLRTDSTGPHTYRIDSGQRQSRITWTQSELMYCIEHSTQSRFFYNPLSSWVTSSACTRDATSGKQGISVNDATFYRKQARDVWKKNAILSNCTRIEEQNNASVPCQCVLQADVTRIDTRLVASQSGWRFSVDVFEWSDHEVTESYLSWDSFVQLLFEANSFWKSLHTSSL